jgi:hypothetical protein
MFLFKQRVTNIYKNVPNTTWSCFENKEGSTKQPFHVNKRAYMASPPTTILKLSDMTPKLGVQNNHTQCYLVLSISLIT